mmetsp:Transcript_8253/g.9461  ORF Transcript_8253/g.9461 Transcript_8253/m.9461 type:complete len:83 (+) Transcript_8253:86-334(+)
MISDNDYISCQMKLSMGGEVDGEVDESGVSYVSYTKSNELTSTVVNIMNYNIEEERKTKNDQHLKPQKVTNKRTYTFTKENE